MADIGLVLNVKALIYEVSVAVRLENEMARVLDVQLSSPSFSEWADAGRRMREESRRGKSEGLRILKGISRVPVKDVRIEDGFVGRDRGFGDSHAAEGQLRGFQQLAFYAGMGQTVWECLERVFRIAGKDDMARTARSIVKEKDRQNAWLEHQIQGLAVKSVQD